MRVRVGGWVLGGEWWLGRCEVIFNITEGG